MSVLQWVTSVKEYADRWNITTVRWVRHVSYERTKRFDPFKSLCACVFLRRSVLGKNQKMCRKTVNLVPVNGRTKTIVEVT